MFSLEKNKRWICILFIKLPIFLLLSDKEELLKAGYVLQEGFSPDFAN
jgi:hypothetical protein